MTQCAAYQSHGLEDTSLLVRDRPSTHTFLSKAQNGFATPHHHLRGPATREIPQGPALCRPGRCTMKDAEYRRVQLKLDKHSSRTNTPQKETTGDKNTNAIKIKHLEAQTNNNLKQTVIRKEVQKKQTPNRSPSKIAEVVATQCGSPVAEPTRLPATSSVCWGYGWHLWAHLPFLA